MKSLQVAHRRPLQDPTDSVSGPGNSPATRHPTAAAFVLFAGALSPDLELPNQRRYRYAWHQVEIDRIVQGDGPLAKLIYDIYRLVIFFT